MGENFEEHNTQEWVLIVIILILSILVILLSPDNRDIPPLMNPPYWTMSDS